MAVSNGQLANANTFNTAFVSRTVNTSLVGKIALQNGESTSVTDAQREHNSISSFVGKALNTASGVLPVWPTSNVGTSGDDLFERVKALDLEFPIQVSDLGGAVTDLADIRVGSSTISNGDDMVTGTFDSALAASGYSLTFSLINLTDSDPIFLQGVCVTKATTHFVVKFNAEADSANYKLDYKAVLLP